MNSHTVIVSGSRTWPWYKQLADALDIELVKARRQGKLLTVRHGGAPDGADRFASAWCRTAHRHLLEFIREDPHPAGWKTSGKSAGYFRNEHMIRLGGDEVLAFLMRCHEARCNGRPAHGTHGTTDLIRKAAGAGLRTTIYRDPSLPQIIEARKEAACSP